jgi:hypothetical protein
MANAAATVHPIAAPTIPAKAASTKVIGNVLIAEYGNFEWHCEPQRQSNLGLPCGRAPPYRSALVAFQTP